MTATMHAAFARALGAREAPEPDEDEDFGVNGNVDNERPAPAFVHPEEGLPAVETRRPAGWSRLGRGRQGRQGDGRRRARDRAVARRAAVTLTMTVGGWMWACAIIGGLLGFVAGWIVRDRLDGREDW